MKTWKKLKQPNKARLPMVRLQLVNKTFPSLIFVLYCIAILKRQILSFLLFCIFIIVRIEVFLKIVFVKKPYIQYSWAYSFHSPITSQIFPISLPIQLCVLSLSLSLFLFQNRKKIQKLQTTNENQNKQVNKR